MSDTVFKLNRVDSRVGSIALVTVDNGEDYTKPTTLGLIHTSKLTSGGARFFLPLALLIGIGAALGSLLLGRTAGPATADGPPVEPTEEE